MPVWPPIIHSHGKELFEHNGKGRDRMGWDGMERDGMEWDRMR